MNEQKKALIYAISVLGDGHRAYRLKYERLLNQHDATQREVEHLKRLLGDALKKKYDE